MAYSLKATLKRSYSAVRSALNEKEQSAWLRDNFYLIDRRYRLAISSKEALKCRNYYKILERYCDTFDFSPDPSELLKYLRSQKHEYSYSELASTAALLSACAINKIAKALNGKRDSRLIPLAVKLLFSLTDPGYSDILPECWAPEKLISEFEETYPEFDKGTKAQYRSLISEYAREKRIGETEAAKELIAKSKAENLPLGALLFRPKRFWRNCWIALTVLFFAILTAAGLYLLGPTALLLLVPFGITATAVSDRLVSLTVPPSPAFRLKLDGIPDDAKTLVAVAALLNGSESDDSVFESLKRFRYKNPDENIYFCLLADLPDSDRQYQLSDQKTAENARRRIDELNREHGARFCLFLRERTLNKSEGRFGGWERKRGAVCELISHICNGNGSGFYGGSFIRDIKYVLTLDSDTNLSVGSVNELLSIALHPANRPIVKNGRVVSGYGIIQPSIKTELTSAYKTGFSRLISGAGGTDVYAGAEFKRSQSLFGSGSFCGKGLIDVKMFNRFVVGKLPEGVVLSHDVIEGSILRTLCASDITLTDSTPSNTVSFFRRQHRWLRGDFQNLCFFRGELLDGFSKYRILLTVLRHSSPIFSFAALTVGCFYAFPNGFWLFVLAYSEFIIPCAISVIGFLFSGSPFACLRFFSKAYSMLTQTFMRLLFELSSLCRRAVLTINAFSLAATRLITKKKTLEWTTAAQAEKLSSTLGKYVLDSALSATAGLAFLIFAKTPFVRFAGLLFFVYPLISTVLSRQISGGGQARPALSAKQKRMLAVHAADMFGFYNENVGEGTNHLPPDNIQFSPVSSVAMRTSPTNIGFYLVSLLAARDLGVIDSKQLSLRLKNTFSTIEKLAKYKGNLYNWYDISTLAEIGNGYVSTVDCGNFTVMLIALKEGLREYLDEEESLYDAVSSAEKLLADAELTPLYDYRRELFFIGLNARNGKADNSCYDLLMSEARMTAYYAVASSTVSKRHWQSLGRTLTHKNGYIGMMSWSGTAFEYLMPQLFLPLYRDSFLFESVAFSLMLQRLENPIWGVSESAFYSFDSDMNYQYKANGLQALALRRCASDEKIISPYSTYLSLCVYGNAAMKNLAELESAGMYGKYGFYEALDLNSGNGICVKSYMAHHVGMSIIACMNAINDNIFVRRFMSDIRMSSASELLQEKIPTDAHVFGDAVFRSGEPKKLVSERNKRTEQINPDSPTTALLSCGDMAAIISGNGHIALRCGERLISHTQFYKRSLIFSPAVIFTRNRKSFGCTDLSGGESGNYGFEHGNGYAAHIASGSDFSGRVRYSFSKNGNCFVVNTRAEALKKYDITLVFEPVLDTAKNFFSHISFSKLFIESEYDKTKRILYFHRRSREDGRYVFSVAIAPKDRETAFSFLASRECFKANSITSPSDYALAQTDCVAGELIDPICLVRADDADGGKATFLITCGVTKNECERNIRAARADKGEQPSPKNAGDAEALLPSLLYNSEPTEVSAFSSCGIGDLWSKGISGDHPRITVYIRREAISRTEKLLRGFLALSRLCIRCELIFIINDSDNYNRPIECAVRECCVNTGSEKYIGKNGGIFLLRERELSPELKQTLIKSSKLFLDFTDTPPEAKRSAKAWLKTIETPQNASDIAVPSDCLRSGNGFFTPDGYTVDKSVLPDAPYSFILTGVRFSTVVTQSSLGYTFFDNARERRLCAFSGDPKTLDCGERVFLTLGDTRFDLCACSKAVSYSLGKAIYSGEINRISYTVTVAVHPRFPVKLISIKCSQPDCRMSFEIKPVMGDGAFATEKAETAAFYGSGNDCVLFRNPFGITFPEGRGFAGVCGGKADASSCTFEAKGSEAIFFLGSCSTENGAKRVASLINQAFLEKTVSSATQFAESLIPKFKIKTKNASIDALMNLFLPYQVAACRFLARGSFYQSGGAYGFRDQLQDCLALIYSLPDSVRNHIIRCCAHQYTDGSVMHWWHTRNYGSVNRGIKSKCSDDLLYLPIVAADYIEKTGDLSILDVNIEYITSPPLGDKSERYEQPTRSGVKENVYLHCLRALSRAERIGVNGLILMGSCDWNDAFSLVGEKGRGESVFSTLLFVIAAERFIPIMEMRGDIESAAHYKETAKRLKTAVEDKMFYGDRYARAVCDDGTVLGVKGCAECEIDILSQAFASIAGLDRKRVKTALTTAFSALYDRDANIFKLFSPPFKNGRVRVGYIRGYAAGTRENGGQYTHGALWGALGFIKAGMTEEALTVIGCADPASRCKDKAGSKRFKTEPYAIPADIYSGVNAGRGGWSWYTGAAAWFYRIMRQYVLGLNFGADGILLSAEPIIPFEAETTLGNAKIKVIASEKTIFPKLNGEAAAFPLRFTAAENLLELPIKE